MSEDPSGGADEDARGLAIGEPHSAILGIAVVTYRRRRHLLATVEAISRFTQAPHELVIAEDGGDPDLVRECRAQGLTVLSGAHRGVARNKNRGLFALAARRCDPLLLIEDDVRPAVAGWEQEWIEGTRRWGHLAYLHPKVAKHTVSGAGSAADPYVNPAATAQCLSVSARVLAEVGYLDSRFAGWGHEHAEWTTRIKRAGHGFKEVELPDGRSAKAQLYLSGGLAAERTTSFRDEAQAARNRALSASLRDESLYRLPWRDTGEREEFLAEQAAGGIEGEAFAMRLESRTCRR